MTGIVKIYSHETLLGLFRCDKRLNPKGVADDIVKYEIGRYLGANRFTFENKLGTYCYRLSAVDGKTWKEAEHYVPVRADV